MRRGVCIAHPERQHSHELALALHCAGMLQRYVHGAPLPAHVRTSVPYGLRQLMPVSRVARVLASRLLPQASARRLFYRSMWAFDRLVANDLVRRAGQAVVAYENSALHTFRAARRSGLACILDHAAVHPGMQARLQSNSDASSFDELVVARKHEELELADLILTCSTFAADSFTQAGIAPRKLRIVPLGCDVRAFSPAGRPMRPAGGPVRFLYVGRLGRAKGTDVLVEAAQSLRHCHIPFELTVVGAFSDADPMLRERLHAVARVLPQQPHEALPTLYANADCLVHPSRFDSFAFVVAEALASGIPAIVSDHVGAKDMIVENETGWVVPVGDSTALARRMRWCVENADRLAPLQAATRAKAEAWSWSRYHGSVAATVSAFLSETSAMKASHSGSLNDPHQIRQA